MKPLIVGLISDTHGLLRPEALAALRGSDFIIHAGDIGDPEILSRLAEIAPLTAIRGNNDVDAAYAQVPERAWLAIGEARIYVLHNRAELNPAIDWNPADGAAHAVISGHSHKPSCERCDGVLFVNPGSSGPRRFKLPIGIGRLTVSGTKIEAELLELTV
ncbi:MAG: putative phosphoesterase [Nevskia sp.]|nr:putative phosphoesterase [Nevskia sp.]